MSTQSYDQFRTFLSNKARTVLFTKQEPDMWDEYFEHLGPCPEKHVRNFHITGFMTDTAVIMLTTVLDREIGKPIPQPDLRTLPVKPIVHIGCDEGLDQAVNDWLNQLDSCLVYLNEEHRGLDRERIISHFWSGLQVNNRVTVVL